IASYLNLAPAADSVFFLRSESRSSIDCLLLLAVLGSFSFDYQARLRLGGLNMSEFVLVDTVLPRRSEVGAVQDELLGLVGPLALCAPAFAPEWLGVFGSGGPPWRSRWALTGHERLRLCCMLDAVVARLYGLERSDMERILTDCDRPREFLAERSLELNPKGHWRVDKDRRPEHRHSVLTLVASRDLERCIAESCGDPLAGIRAFCAANRGQGWQLPETLCLAELGLGHDERARSEQPVRSCFGPRFLPEQLAAEDDCAFHAERVSALHRELREAL
ncbi:MAG: hypothetical protein ACE5F1_04550, partial [Planctomycetota bacterium]